MPDIDGKKPLPVLDFKKQPEFLTVEEFADLLVMNVKTVYAAIKNGEIKGVYRIGGCIRIHYPTVVESIRTQGAGSRSKRRK